MMKRPPRSIDKPVSVRPKLPASVRRPSDKEVLEGLLNGYSEDLSGLECDGLTRVCHYVLRQHGIAHRCFSGECKFGKTTVPVHFWITSGRYVVDYRLRMWCGDEAPHGVFEADSSDVEYHGEEIQLNVPPVLFSILSNGK